MERQARGPLKAGAAPRSGACTEARRQHHQLRERQGLGLSAEPRGNQPCCPWIPTSGPQSCERPRPCAAGQRLSRSHSPSRHRQEMNAGSYQNAFF